MGKIIQLFNKMGENTMVSIFDVANYFISRAQVEEESIITPLKLQKLCYYAKAWSLVWDNNPLFNEDFQAWAHGPANYDLFKRYQDHRFHPITEVDDDFDSSIFTDEELETLDAVWDAYGIYDGKYLEQLTHSERPWKDARGDCAPGERCNTVIETCAMREYYLSLQDE
jgi:uncharacterized phage-associated protein